MTSKFKPHSFVDFIKSFPISFYKFGMQYASNRIVNKIEKEKYQLLCITAINLCPFWFVLLMPLPLPLKRVKQIEMLKLEHAYCFQLGFWQKNSIRMSIK